VVVFQPHRYSRTQALMAEFGSALSGADEIVLTDIYAAGEAQIPGVTVEALASAIRASARGTVRVVAALEQLPSAVADSARPGDLVITLGAGSIGTVGERILDALRRRSASAANGGRR
jgi:UDP-N-acetylmuramate--alanine ligase